MPDIRGFRETVPYAALRYRPYDIDHAVSIMQDVMVGTYDDIQFDLIQYMRQFDAVCFKSTIQKIILGKTK